MEKHSSIEQQRLKNRWATLKASFDDWEDDSYLNKQSNNNDEIFKYSNKVLYQRPGSKSNSQKKNKKLFKDVTNEETKFFKPIYPTLDLEDNIPINNENLFPSIFNLSNKSEEEYKLHKTSPKTLIIEYKQSKNEQPNNVSENLFQNDSIKSNDDVTLSQCNHDTCNEDTEPSAHLDISSDIDKVSGIVLEGDMFKETVYRTPTILKHEKKDEFSCDEMCDLIVNCPNANLQALKEDRLNDINGISKSKIVSNFKKQVTSDSETTNKEVINNKSLHGNNDNKLKSNELKSLVAQWEIAILNNSTPQKYVTPVRKLDDAKTTFIQPDMYGSNQKNIKNFEPKKTPNKGIRPEIFLYNKESHNVSEPKLSSRNASPFQAFEGDTIKSNDVEEIENNHDLTVMINDDLNLSLRLSDFDKMTETFKIPNIEKHGKMFEKSQGKTSNMSPPKSSTKEITFTPCSSHQKIDKIITYDPLHSSNNSLKKNARSKYQYSILQSPSSPSLFNLNEDNDNPFNTLHSPQNPFATFGDRNKLQNILELNREILTDINNYEIYGKRCLTYSQKIQELVGMVETQQIIIKQIGQALLLSMNNLNQEKKSNLPFPQERIEAEKLNFIARQKRQFYLEEIERLKREEKVILDILNQEFVGCMEDIKSPFTLAIDTSKLTDSILTISGIKLFLKQDFPQKLSNPNEIMTFYFLCLFKHGLQIVFTTELTPLTIFTKMNGEEGFSDNGKFECKNREFTIPPYLNINNCINIHDIDENDWKIDLEIHILYTCSKIESKSGSNNFYASLPKLSTLTSNMNLTSSGSSNSPNLLSKLTTHLTTPNKKKMANQAVTLTNSNKMINTNNSPVSGHSKHIYNNNSHHDSSQSGTGVFTLHGFTTITKNECGNRNRIFKLKKVPNLSPLLGTINLNIKCQTQIPYRGFLNKFEIVHGLGSWSRVWFVLSGQYLSYWKYPEHETIKPPIERLDLTHITESRIEPLSLNECAKPFTICFNVFRDSFCDNSVISESDFLLADRLAQNTHKYLLSADTKELITEWCIVLNQALSQINNWDKLYPNINEQYN